jgi:hypothetical protein
VSVFWEGDVLESTLAVFDLNGSPADPLTVLFIYQIETATPITSPGVHDSLGNFHYDIDTTNKPGRYYWRWETTGNPQIATPDQVFVVRNSKLWPHP